MRVKVKVYTTVYGVSDPSAEVIRLHQMELEKIAEAIKAGATEYIPQTELFQYELYWIEPDGGISLTVWVDESNLVIVGVEINYD